MFLQKQCLTLNYGLKTVGSATECFRQKQNVEKSMVLKQSGALPNVFAKKQCLTLWS